MAKRFYTVLVLPDATSPARVFHVSQTVLAALSLVAVLAVLGFALCLNQYLTLHARMLELKQDRPGTGDRSSAAEPVSHLEGETSRPGDHARRLQAVVGLERSAARSPFLGQGEADTASRTVPLDAPEKRTEVVMSMSHDLAALKQEVHSRERSLRALKAYLVRKAAILASTPSILPVRGWVTSGYGYRNSPFTGQRDFHEGLDIAAPYGAPIVATADGIVSSAGPMGDYGNAVLIDHGHGFTTLYGHNSKNRVRAGQRVRRGDIIAHVGSSGRTTGPHVHYGVYVKRVNSNPLNYIGKTAGVRVAEGTRADTSS